MGLKQGDQGVMIDQIVKEVLFKLGHIEKITLIEGASYPEEWLNQLKDTHLVEYISDIEDLDRIECNTHALWLPELCISQMMSVVKGMPQGKIAEILFKALIKGKSVHILSECVELLREDIIRSPLTEPFFDALTRLSQSGLKIQVSKAFQPEKTVGTFNIGEALEVGLEGVTFYFEKKVLTEKQLETFVNRGINRVVITKNTILTPSAIDYIRINPIKIDRK